MVSMPNAMTIVDWTLSYIGSVGPLPWLIILNGYDDDNLTDVFWPEICH